MVKIKVVGFVDESFRSDTIWVFLDFFKKRKESMNQIFKDWISKDSGLPNPDF